MHVTVAAGNTGDNIVRCIVADIIALLLIILKLYSAIDGSQEEIGLG